MLLTPELKTFLKDKIIIICGPTASGKSSFALKLGDFLNGRIINADSMQIYKEIPILTSQPSDIDKQYIPHNLYGFISLLDNCTVKSGKRFSLGNWIELCLKEIENCFHLHSVPIIVGGTGMYLNALVNGLSIIPNVNIYVEEYLKHYADNDSLALYKMLENYDINSAKTIKPNDKQRIVRALSVFLTHGTTISTFKQKQTQLFYPKSKFYIIYIKPERTTLYQNINNRFELMLKNGAIEEVKYLLDKTERIDLSTWPKAIGLKEIEDYLLGRSSIENATTSAQQFTRNYAKRQLTWFNKFSNDYNLVITDSSHF